MIQEASDAAPARLPRPKLAARWAPPAASFPRSYFVVPPEALPIGERLVWPRWLSIGVPTEEPSPAPSPSSRSTANTRRPTAMLAHL